MDTLDEELTTEDVISRERNIDKELILLIQAACKSDDTPRVIELVKLLHQLPSFDAAIKIAGFYHLLGLQEKLAVLKNEREEAEDRLEVLRKKRKRGMKVTNVPREIDYSSTTTATKRNGGGRYDPLGDTGPPPMIERPGMSRVEKPLVERTKFSAITTMAQAQPAREDDSSAMVTRSPSPFAWDDSELAGGGSSLGDDNSYNTLGGGEESVGSMTTTMGGTAQKRKRSDDAEDTGVSQLSDVSVMPPPKQSMFSATPFFVRGLTKSLIIFFFELETNPFARKHNTSESSATRNPFSSRPKSSAAALNGGSGGGGITSRGSIHKSDSFFDKVEAASENSKKSTTKKSGSSKSKDKSSSSSSTSANSGPKQTTLFGMMPRAFQTSQAPKQALGEDKKCSREDGGEDDGIGEETQELLSSITDVGTSDSQMTLMDSRGLEESQGNEETQF